MKVYDTEKNETIMAEDIPKKYLVTIDGCQNYGSELYFVGLFNTKEVAETAINDVLIHARSIDGLKDRVSENNFKITEIDEGWWHFLHVIDDRTIGSDIYLGGYQE